MQYISHVLYYPNARPFDQPDSRWQAFIGEFVAPLVLARPNLLFWFTHYGDHAKFRLYTDHYDSLCPELETLRDKLGLVDRGQEKELTLIKDIGGRRFIGSSSNSTPNRRAELILQSLCAVARLVVDSVVKQDDGYWRFEQNEDNAQNPDGSHFFSVTHLFHNMCASDALVCLFQHGGIPTVLSYYYFRNAAEARQINPDGHKCFWVKM